ncbi:GATA zinc finger domain-containing protein 1-like [Xenia sp. Carnegie-2017]|uniref:GATA zinc finger domain-containing protein 1-like n=1 Tax=Xenia sp. Carnegie-2017 TaxID=2897299 RepID=UPI001F04E9C5|nr:GATA zinc finger domain-containing protein 1-like [Xenia sp. Carnegie-2017]
MPYGEQYQCAACKIYKSLMWRKGSNGETLCNGCHLKRVNAFLRTQRSSISKIDSRRISTKGRYGKGKILGGKTSDRSGKNCANRGRRSIVKQKPQKSPNIEATFVTSDSVFHKGILYQSGDVVSLQDIDGSLYYAQTRGFLQDQYACKSCVLTWLIPTIPNPSNFDPMYFIQGPHEDTPRSMDCIEFVCRAPSELFKKFDCHPPFVLPRKPNFDDLVQAANHMLDE